ncbi:MAG: hypothetical protein Q9M11_06190 [Mariprofundaceae bacterium]|nr:hypothetical protein [Mariprofundaceae bacterium]
MSSNKSRSLAQHFDAPKDYTGCFGWLCGYSADDRFLNAAVEYFTHLIDSQRASQGQIYLAAFLNPENRPISCLETPGVAHCLRIDKPTKPFRLLHAKVAILGFQHKENPKQWQLRLLVSTGNWTQQTLEESLDLIWRIDISSESLDTIDIGIRQDCTDIQSAWSLIQYIQALFDTRLLDSAKNGNFSHTKKSVEKVSGWLEKCKKIARSYPRCPPRFLDNRKISLVSQLSKKININGDVKRNYLAMGSGFYESSNDSHGSPKVPLNIINRLKEVNLLTKTATIDMYVNPKACQSVASSKKELRDVMGITIRPAATSKFVFKDGVPRTLHAKFLFSANHRNNSSLCNNAWVYLGSGNLTHPGFAKKMSANGGNLEAGVVFFPHVYWQDNKKIKESQVITHLLPIQWDTDLNEDSHVLEVGSDMEQSNESYIAPPVAWLNCFEDGDKCELRSDDPHISDIQVLDPSGKLCKKTATGFLWNHPQPRQVYISWETEAGQANEIAIPIIDQYGRIAATALAAIDIEEALWKLLSFPTPTNDEVDEGEEINDDNNVNKNKDANKKDSALIADYPIRKMMKIIESIAAQQVTKNEDNWELWCARLEQILNQAKDCEPVKYFRDDLKLNPLSPLRHQPFRPSFAESSDSTHGNLYEETLNRIEKRWKVQFLDPIGGMQ